MNIEKLNNEPKPSVEQEKIIQSEKAPTLCEGCGESLRYVGLNYRNKRIWRCENKKCGREGAGIVIEEGAQN